jgi:type III restriction/modification enzyme restriction subunit
VAVVVVVLDLVLLARGLVPTVGGPEGDGGAGGAGSGKTFTACNISYRLVKHADARRILFLVDRANLGRQTLREFQSFVIPATQRKFTDEYIVQHLSSNHLDKTARVTITTIQRLYSILKGEPELDPEIDEHSTYDLTPTVPVPVEYSPTVPIEFFDVVIIDECHRSIYGLWRQVLDYFDAFLIGLTATPNKQAFGFFNQKPRDGVHPRGGRGRWRERRLRRVPHPHREPPAGQRRVIVLSLTIGCRQPCAG